MNLLTCSKQTVFTFSKRKKYSKMLTPQIKKVMKLTFILLTAFFLQVSAAGFSQTVTLSFNNVPIEKVFREIKLQTGIGFIYTKKMLQEVNRVSIDVKNKPVTEVLKQCFIGQPLDYAIDENTIVITKKPMATINKATENIVEFAVPPIDVKGKVTDENGLALSGVSVIIKGSKKGTSTNANGEYAINGVEENSMITFSMVGHISQSFSVGNNNIINVVLKLKSSNEEEVVIQTGYQTISKERATGSYTLIDSKQLGITNLASINFAKGLEGLAPGLLVNNDGSLQVRGVSSIKSDSRPLIVVDGFPIESGNYTINPNDIENITILKDAAAASIWGVRASNGVIVIKTKSGKTTDGKAIFDFTTNLSFDEKPDLSYFQRASTADFIDFEKETINKGWFKPASADASGYSLVGELYYKKYKGLINDAQLAAGIDDLKKLDNLSQQDLFYRSALQRQFNLSIRGGSKLYKYYISSFYTKQMNTARGNENENIILNIKNSLQLLPKLLLSVGVNSTFVNSKTSSGYDFSFSRPYEMFLDANGNYVSQYNSIAEHLKQGYYNNGYLNWNSNAKQELDFSNNHQKRFEARFNLGLDFKISKGIVFSSKYLNELGFSNANNLQDLNTYYARNLANKWRVYDNARAAYINKFPVGPIFDKIKDQFNGWTFRNTLSIDKDFKRLHKINAVLGTEVRKIANKGNGERYYNYNQQALTVDNFDVLSLSNYTPNYKGSSDSYNWSPAFYERDRRFFSLFANGAYTYNDLYTISGSTRFDQSNLFGTDPKYRYKPIWSAGLGWKISGEQFMNNIDFVNLLNLRATYGINGNIGNSSPYPIANTGKNFNTQENMLTFSNPENEQLRPEKTAIVNLGLDFSILENRLSGSVDYYRKRSFDLLGNSILDPTTGFNRAEKNTAEMINKGVDVNLNIKVIQTKFLFDVVFNFGYNKNKVEKVLMPTTTASSFITGSSPIEGKPLSYLYSYRWAGLSAIGEPQIFNANNEIVSWAAAEMSDVKGLHYVGTLTPPVYGGMMLNLQYKGFSLLPQFTYKMGHVLRLPSTRMDLYGGALNTIAKRWQKPGDEAITDIPVVYKNSTGSTKWTNYYRYSDVYDGEASLIRLRSLTLSYEVPTKYIKNLFSGIKITAQGNNLWLWTANKNNIDPDYYNLRSGYFSFPPVKNYVISLNLNF